MQSVTRYGASGVTSKDFTIPGGRTATLKESHTKHFVYDVHDRLVYEYGTNPEVDPQTEKYNEQVFLTERGRRVAVFEKNDTALAATHLLLPDPTADRMLAEEYILPGAVPTSHTIWPLHDHQGTVIAAYSDSWLGGQQDLEYFEYDTFGVAKFDVEQNPSLSRRLIGLHHSRDWDEDVELYYNRARWYSPASGRFISEDPIGFGGGDPNLYRALGNSPMNATDPTGNSAVSDWMYGRDGAIYNLEDPMLDYFEAHPEQAEWMANRTQTQMVAASFAIAVPLGLGLFYGGSAVVGMGLKGAGIYFATQGGISALESTIEWGIASQTNAPFSWGPSLGKNFVVNSLTGGIGSKGKWLRKAGAWVGRQGIEIVGDTAIDVGVYGADLRTSLAWNTIGGVGGEALFKTLGRGLRKFDSHFEMLSDGGVYTNSISVASSLRIHRRDGVRSANPIQGLPRTGSALKTDPTHAFPDLVDNFVGDARKFRIPTKGPGGKIVRESDLYQLEGSLRGKPGVFEWIVDQGQVTHRRFIPGGKTTGFSNQVPGGR